MSTPQDPAALWPQIDVTLDGKTWTLKPTFDALARIERAGGVGIVELLYRFHSQRHGFTDVARVLYEGIRAEHGNAAPPFEAIGESIVRAGLHETTSTALSFVTAAIAGLAARETDTEETADPTTPPTETDDSLGGSSSEAPSRSDSSPATSGG